MALYAFDGTWQKDEPLDLKDSNVVKFRDSYGDKKVYISGIGTGGKIDLVLGGLFGVGGQKRIREAMQQLNKRFSQGDTEIDIVGFSRGAALALDFANEVARKGAGGVRFPPIRFLGLWDVVGSFGVPGNDINIGYSLTVPNNVIKCYHALALDERRWTFTPVRLTANVRDARKKGRVFEVWFRGVHSDIGGGNKNIGLSNITLCWMLKKALKHKLPVNENNITKYQAKIKKTAKVSPNFDPVKDPWRNVGPFDVVHNSVSWREGHKNPPQYLAVVNDAGNLKPEAFAKGRTLPKPKKIEDGGEEFIDP